MDESGTDEHMVSSAHEMEKTGCCECKSDDGENEALRQ